MGHGFRTTLPLGVMMLLFSVAPLHGDFIRGDANDDTVVDISDAVRILGALFIPGSDPLDCLDAGDSNDDGSFDVSDSVYLLAYLFQPGSPAPPAPFPDAGPDPTPDALGDCDPVPVVLPFTTIAQGQYSGLGEQLTIVRDQATWITVWSQHDPTGIGPPAVDFSTEMVVVIVRSFPTGGYAVEITELRSVVPTGIEVDYDLGEPLGFCFATLLPTNVHHIVRCTLAPGDPIPLETIVDSCP